MLCRPVVNGKMLRKQTRLTLATVNKSLDHLCKLGIAMELTGQKRYRVFSYQEYVAILAEGTEPPEAN